MKYKLLILFLFLAFSTIIPFHCFAQDTSGHEIRISVNYILPEEFYQGIPLAVQFKIENIGYGNFTGEVILKTKMLENREYEDKIFQIQNLAPNQVYVNSTSYSTDFAGRIYTTFHLESDLNDYVKFYEGEKLESEGFRIEKGISIFVKSYDTYLRELELETSEKNLQANQIRVIVAIVVGVITVFGVYLTYKNYQSGKNQNSENNGKKKKQNESKKSDKKNDAPFNESIEMSKLKTLENHLQGIINTMYSLLLGSYVSITALIATITFQTMDIRFMILGMGISFFFILLAGTYYVKKYQKRNLNFIDELIMKIENGEHLPSILELEKEVSKRQI